MFGTLTQMSPPAAATTLITVADAKAHCNVTHNADDGVIADKINAAVAYLDGEGILNRALLQQSWRYRAADFCGGLQLPLPPTKTVTKVAYVDLAGTETLIAPAAYRVEPGGYHGDTIYKLDTWPATPSRPAEQPIAVEFTAGYTTPAAVPAPIREALLRIIADSYSFRESVGTGSIFVSVPTQADVDALLEPYRQRAL